MVTQDDQTIKLEMVIDRAELERQLGTIFQGPAGKAASGAAGAGAGGGSGGGLAGPGGRRPGDPKQATLVRPDAGMAKQLQHLTRLAGIYFGISAMAKNSQILSTTMGALGSIMGAIMDSFLAPFMPMIAKALTKIADLIPKAAEAGEATVEVIDSLVKGPGKIKDVMAEKSAWGKFKMGAEMVDYAIGNTVKGVLGGLRDDSPGWLQTSAAKEFRRVNVEREKSGLDPLPAWKRWTGTGPLPGDYRETTEARYGKEIAPGITGTPELLSTLKQMNDNTLQRFIELSTKNAPKFEISIQGMTMDQIMDNLRREIDTKLTEAGHASGLGKP